VSAVFSWRGVVLVAPGARIPRSLPSGHGDPNVGQPVDVEGVPDPVVGVGGAEPVVGAVCVGVVGVGVADVHEVAVARGAGE
jgi:hypothetical protein